MDNLYRNALYAFRSFIKRPFFALAVTITVALAIGTNTAIMGIMDFLFFRPPAHVRNPQELISINVPLGFNYQTYQDLLNLNDFLGPLTAYKVDTFSVDKGYAARELPVAMVTPGYFPLLGVAPHAGRYFTEDDATHPVAVISYEFWQRKFNGESAVLGKEILIANKYYTIIGVTPEGFRGITPGSTYIWVPATNAPGRYKSTEYLTSRETPWLSLLTRLKTQIPREEIQRRITEAYVSQGGRPEWKAAIYDLNELRFGDRQRKNLLILLAATGGIVLLICCINVAVLLLVRFQDRSREAAIRAAMGASRFHLTEQFLTESIILALFGGVAGIPLSLWIVGLFRHSHLMANIPLSELLDLRTGILTFITVLFVGLLGGFLPALFKSKPNLMALINSSGHSSTPGKSWTQRVLVIAQIAITFAALIETSMLFRSLENWRAVDMGFDHENTIIAHIDLKNAGYSLSDIRLLNEQITEELKSLPSVSDVSIAYTNLFKGGAYVGVRVPGTEPNPTLKTRIIIVTPTYFSSLGINILSGRAFRRGDLVDATPRVVISKKLADSLWSQEQPLGKCIFYREKPICHRVIGVAQNVRYFDVRFFPEPENILYALPTPLNQEVIEAVLTVSQHVFLVNSTGDLDEVSAQVRQAMFHTRPNLPHITVRPVQTEIFGEQLTNWRIAAVGSTLFGSLTLVMAIVGLSSILVQSTQHKKKEIAIRMALGASQSRIIRSTLWLALKVTVIGGGIGTAGAFAMASLISHFHYGVRPTDVPTFLGVWLILLAIASLATFVPAYRITRIDLAETLGAE